MYLISPENLSKIIRIGYGRFFDFCWNMISEKQLRRGLIAGANKVG
jgi:hypothetical protein